ncbi:hypothetical protein Trydic_g21631 [Trypoxylus dichotomus]
MRKVTFFITIAMALTATIAEPKKEARALIEDIIIGMLECARGMLKEGVPEVGFPSLNNLTIEQANFILSDFSSDFEGFIDVEDFVFAGLTDYETRSVGGSIGLIPPSYTADIQLNFPNPILYTKYDTIFKSEVDELDFFGTGVVQMNAYNFLTRIRARITILQGIALDYFEFWPTLQGLNSFKITGVNHDEEYSAYVSDYIFWDGTFLVADLSYRINEIVSKIFLDMAADGSLFEEGGFINHLFTYCT